MNLYAPLSAAEADQAEQGVLRGDHIWVDHPAPDDAGGADVVWVSIEMPDNRLPRFERRDSAREGHREFLLPSRVTNLHRALRVEPPL